MPMLQYHELVVALGVLIFAVGPTCLVLQKFPMTIRSDRDITVVALLWVAFCLLEYYVFGPYSFIARETDSYFLAFRYFNANVHDGGQFASQMGGGQDVGLILSNKVFFQPESLLIGFLAPWLVLLFHKTLVVTVGLFGSYLLALRALEGTSRHGDRLLAFSVASLFPLSHFYLVDFGLEFGSGFAVIPLTLYIVIGRHKGLAFLAWLIGVATLVAVAQPMKVLPALFVAVVAGMVMFGERRIARSALVLVFCTAIALLNWCLVLDAVGTLVRFTSRALDTKSDSVSWSAAAFGAVEFFLAIPIPSFFYLLGAGALWMHRDPFGWRSSYAICIVAIIFVAIVMFPWHSIGLGIVGSIEHGYMRLSVATLFVPVLARAIATLEGSKNWWRIVRVDSIVLALSISLMIWIKVIHAASYIAFGGQAGVFHYDDLQKPAWLSGSPVRVVTLMDTPHPGVIAGVYGIESFDGNIILNVAGWNLYWRGIRREPLIAHRTATRPELDWHYWDGKTYDVGGNLDLDLLRRANVGFILSPVPLTGNGLRPVVTALREDWPYFRRSDFPSLFAFLQFRIIRIFDPGRHHVYQIMGATPRIRAARTVDTVAERAGPDEILSRIKEANDITAIVHKDDAINLIPTASMDIKAYQKVSDGYDVNIDAPNGGVLLVNNSYLPFWHATANGVNLKIVSANIIEMAVSIPPNTENIKIRYARPTVWDRLSQ